MALLALHKCDERYAVLSDNFNSIKKELGELKDAVSSGTPQVMSKKETCRLRHLKDVNPETDLEYTIPDGMVHIGGGKCINLVQVAKLEKLDDLRGRLAGLCRLYWPGKELNEWSLSGKTKHKITNDYSAGMAEILRCMHWIKKANLEHSNVHRTLSRVISELHNKKGPNKSYWQKSPVKEKIRDITEQSNEDKQDEDGEDSSQEKQNERSGSESDDGGKSNHTGSDSDSE